jgi:phosphoribosylaminoimidazolecarboxamide formyltransferase/IMP cyclohydrolase
MLHAAAPLPPPPDRAPIRRALLSVSDKAGLVPFAQRLARLGVELVSTGGTARALREAGLDVIDASEVTGLPEILDGRVKTLHPAVHGAILARRTSDADLATLDEYGITPIDLVVVNLYPFGQAVAQPDVDDATAAENIDIGGPTMVRAAAKNWAFVAVAVDPLRYGELADEMEAHRGALTAATRRSLARAAFAHTAAYDDAIAAFFAREDAAAGALQQASSSAFELPDLSELPREELRYGENPHQRAALLRTHDAFRTLHGRDLSYNNLLDLSAAIGVIGAFRHHEPTVAILKHTNPCGVAVRASLADAYDAAFATDRQSPFGGIVVVNRPLTMEAAQKIDAVFTELVIAPGFEEGVLDFLMQKANRRLIEMTRWAGDDLMPDLRSVAGGLLVQDADPVLPPAPKLRADWQVVTKRAPTEAEWADLDFAWRVAKHVKSNTIVYARERATMGIGAGQMSRIDSAEIAASKAAKSGLDLGGAVVASDAFFPFADGLLAAAGEGIRAVVQPGGSIRDDEVIAAADAHDLAMVFTGRRHFRH